MPATAMLVPDPDVWRVGGHGRALAARRRPNGRIAWASVAIDLSRPSELLLFGNLDVDEGEFEEVLAGLSSIDGCAPMIGGGAALAGRFAWGSVVYARARGLGFDEHDPTLLAVFARPASHDAEMLRLFAGDGDGLADPELLSFCHREEEAALPAGEGLVTFVAMAFRTRDQDGLARALALDASFAPNGLAQDAWRLELDWAPLGRETRGSVVIDGGRVRADAISLPHATRLCATLKRHARDLELIAIERRTVEEVLAHRARAG